MWLDGVFFLPLMLLMVYEIVRGKNSGWKLSVVVGLAIISNWYSAGLNCLFSIVQIPGRESHVHGVLEPPSRSFRATFTE